MALAEEEFAGAELGDKRFNRRLIKLTERFSDKPTASIPGACADWSETAATYRFFDQTNIDDRVGRNIYERNRIIAQLRKL
jgi:hypothetical protein